MENESRAFNNVIPKIQEKPKGEGLLKESIRPGEISTIYFRTITTHICKEINSEFYNIEGEVIQGLKVPLDFLSTIQDYEKTRIGNELYKRLFKIGQDGESVQKEGIYIFCDAKTSSTTKKIYIGESNELLTRLNNHEKKKEGSFSSILIITSLTDVGKDKLKIIESKLINKFKNTHNFEVINKQEKTKFHVDIFDDSIVNKYLDIISDLIERNC